MVEFDHFKSQKKLEKLFFRLYQLFSVSLRQTIKSKRYGKV